jgi:ABC-type multidrug transport system ATPase subunit
MKVLKFNESQIPGSPNLVILDEPCSGVDTNARKNIWELIEALRKGRAVVLATHFLDEAQHLGDSIIILKDGKIAYESTSSNLQDQLTKSFTMNVEFCTPLMNDQNDTLSRIKKMLSENVVHFDITSIADSNLSVVIPYGNADGAAYE